MSLSKQIGAILLGFLAVPVFVTANSGSVFFKFDSQCINYSNTLANQLKCVFRVSDDKDIKLQFSKTVNSDYIYQQNQNSEDGQNIFVENINWPLIIYGNQKKNSDTSVNGAKLDDTDNYTEVMNYTSNGGANSTETLFKLGILFLDHQEIDSSNSVIISVVKKDGSLNVSQSGNAIDSSNKFQLGTDNPIYCNITTKKDDIFISCNCTGFKN
ncbi:hypothetical protein OAO18_06985 [Francisellaceae bacterium]|nr:hypothetical protein [Francisellaceae bacterium]